ncbi:hypothetical protein pETSU_118 [Edwardsiella phage pEt-SU]|uniref:Uncharacterized protein n=1 Tax=Edwardsiella phage pEt-SU TaxID=2562142 RepID=A0A4D6DYF2_9CAUD|nr:hypothetical protein HOV39_gp118 [Edwardsiella phage pEt-SU]QBZ70699.1 hypothetical protein pETSU_118 [Edwardsiella phage pEt-SU]
MVSKCLIRIEELEDKLDRASMLGDNQLISTIADKLEVCNAMSDEEYLTFEKVTKMYATASVKAIPLTI